MRTSAPPSTLSGWAARSSASSSLDRVPQLARRPRRRAARPGLPDQRQRRGRGPPAPGRRAPADDGQDAATAKSARSSRWRSSPSCSSALWPLTEGRRVSKTRLRAPLADGLEAEVDVYAGDLAGLVVAEVEFASREDERAASSRRPGSASEITGDSRYANRHWPKPARRRAAETRADRPQRLPAEAQGGGRRRACGAIAAGRAAKALERSTGSPTTSPPPPSTAPAKTSRSCARSCGWPRRARRGPLRAPKTAATATPAGCSPAAATPRSSSRP